MFIQVKLLNGFPSALLYEVPDSWPVKPLAGALVTVPLKQRVEVAWVIEYLESIPIIASIPYTLSNESGISFNKKKFLLKR